MTTAYQKCVARKLKGRHFRSKRTQKKAFKAAARSCRKFRKAKGKARRVKRRVHRQSSLVRYNKCVAKCQRTVGHTRTPYLYE